MSEPSAEDLLRTLMKYSGWVCDKSDPSECKPCAEARYAHSKISKIIEEARDFVWRSSCEPNCRPEIDRGCDRCLLLAKIEGKDE